MRDTMRVLVVDDDDGLRQTYTAILSPQPESHILDLGAELFGDQPPVARSSGFYAYDVTAVENGTNAVDAVRQALDAQRPYAVAFIDMSMPGIDGAETSKRIWDLDPQVKIAIVTAFSEYKPKDIVRISGREDIFYLRKPFNPEEIEQFARALGRQWLLEREVERQNALLKQLAVTDGLTSLYNHKHILERFEYKIVEAHRYEFPLSIAMVDIDHFKRLNDTYGHQLGDTVLARVASTIRDTLRKSDLLGRYGGEEFLAIFPHVDRDNAYASAERIRTTVEQLTWDEGFQVTLSGGIGELREEEQASQLIMRADRRLYAAKERGRNRIERE